MSKPTPSQPLDLDQFDGFAPGPWGLALIAAEPEDTIA